MQRTGAIRSSAILRAEEVHPREQTGLKKCVCSYCSSAFLISLSATGLLAAGCVSEEEYRQVREQLAIEQQRSKEDRQRRRELELLVENLSKRLKLAELERDRARSTEPNTLTVETKPSHQEEWRLVGTIYFDAGRDTLTDSDRERIATLAQEIAAMGPVYVSIEGHSDPTPLGRSQGQYQSNMHLSAARALAVYHALVTQPGIAPERVSVSAFGEHKPPADGPGAGSNALRRVEIRCSPRR